MPPKRAGGAPRDGRQIPVSPMELDQGPDVDVAYPVAIGHHERLVG